MLRYADYDDALVWYTEGQKILFEYVDKNTTNSKFLKYIAYCYKCLSNIYSKTNNHKNSIYYAEECVSCFKAISKSLNTIDSKLNLAMSYNILGEAYENDEQYDEAKDWYNKSLKYKQRIKINRQYYNIDRDISISYERLGAVCEKTNDTDNALKYYNKMLSCDIAKFINYNSILSIDDLMKSYHCLSLCNIENKYIYNKKYMDLLTLLNNTYPQLSSYHNNQ